MIPPNLVPFEEILTSYGDENTFLHHGVEGCTCVEWAWRSAIGVVDCRYRTTKNPDAEKIEYILWQEDAV